MNLHAALVTLLEATVPMDGDRQVGAARKRVAQKVASLAPVFDRARRLPGGPPICEFENRPSFETEWDANVFAVHKIGRPILEKWECEKCGYWHATFEPSALELRRKKA